MITHLVDTLQTLPVVFGALVQGLRISVHRSSAISKAESKKQRVLDSSEELFSEPSLQKKDSAGV